MQPTSGKPDRTLLVIVAIIAAVVVLALVVVFTRGAPAPLDPTTPGGVVQSYTRAVVSDDRPAAMQLLSAEIRAACERTDPGTMTNIRLTIVSVKVAGDTAVVRVSIAHGGSGGVFGSSSYDTEDSFTLVQDSDAWKIDSAPWELTICYNQEVGK